MNKESGMNRRIPLFLLLISVLIGACDLTIPPDNYSTQNQALELTLRFEQTTYYVSEPVVAVVTLRNIGKEAILINSRMAMDLPYRPSPIREIAFKVTTPSGENYWPSVKINNWFVQSSDFVALSPGDYMEKNYNLSASSYEFIEGGVYRVVANYQNNIDPSYIDPDDTRIAWKGELNSNEVFLTIIP